MPQVVGNAGMYHATHRLSREGWNVMPTARNARGIDLVAYDASGKRFVGIQIKSLSKRAPVPFGRSAEDLMDDWWIIVSNATSEAPRSYIVNPDEVKRLAHRGEKDGRISHWLQPTQ